MNHVKNILILMMIFVVSSSVFCQQVNLLILNDGIVIKLKRTGGGNFLSPDPVAALIESGEWEIPSVDDELEFNDNVLGKWEKITADENGWIYKDSLFNAYIQYIVEAEKDQVVLVEAMGNTALYVNGTQRSGNPYRYKDDFDPWGPRFDYSLIPVKLKKGENELLFKCNRGLLKVKLHKDAKGLIFTTNDLTVPSIIMGEEADTYGAISLMNATEKSYDNVETKTWVEGSEPVYYPVNNIVSLSISKVPFRIKVPVQSEEGKVKLNVELVQKENGKEKKLSSIVVELDALKAGETHKETFISQIDGSVQYYAVNPPENLKSKPALFLSLHGAGVEALNQAQAYGHKNWGYTVAPTNRRPYGYNWENWGRIDALEVLDIAKSKFGIDESRVYLTGHSMGGHGTWHVGINNADKFAALGPSAGWISIWSYRIRPQHEATEIEKMLTRSSKHSDTYAFTENIKSNGVYILHGQVDDNVPVTQAESIIENLSKFHKDFVYHFEPDANHWWDNSDDAGADCVDWRPMFDFFAHHSVATNDQVKEVDFTTANPAISSKNYWIEVINQKVQQTLSKINMYLEYSNGKFVGTTENIEMFSIDASMLPKDRIVSVDVDDQLIENIVLSADGKIYLKNIDGEWAVSGPVDRSNKYPARCGNLREAFNNNMLFIYGTHGNQQENKWAFEKARLDAEKVWYRGNSSVLVIKDDEFNPVKYKDRSVVLFGNSKTNYAWKLLLEDSPVQVDNEKVVVGNKVYEGEDVGCMMIRPRKDSDIASVAVISGTGIEGMNMANLPPYFDQYIGFPDLLIFDSGILESDIKGVKYMGYFGNDWSIEKGEFLIQ